MRKRIVVFASGTKSGGGSGFQALVENSRIGILDADIVAVVSHHARGGVARRAQSLGIPFEYMENTEDEYVYRGIVRKYRADWVALSGWVKRVKGLHPQRTLNIHPGPLPRFGGRGMYGYYVHEAVLEAFQNGDISHSAVTMHFVTKHYDEGPVFFKLPIPIREDDTPETLGARVNAAEHAWQSFITNLVVREEIRWDGRNPESLVVPPWVPR